MNKKFIKNLMRPLIVISLLCAMFGGTVALERNTIQPVITQVQSNSYDPEGKLTDSANQIYVTKDCVNVRTGAGTENSIYGVLDTNVSVTVTDVKDGWGYVREFKGWVKLTYLEKVNPESIIAVLYTKQDSDIYLLNSPDENSVKTPITNYSVYSSKPYIYNEKYFQIADGKFISKDYVVINYYEKESYRRMLETSRGGIDRSHNISSVSKEAKGFTKIIGKVPNSPSNVTAEQLKVITAGTPFDGIEQALVEIEQKNGVNAIYAISVAMLESGNGHSYLSRNQNNIFGLDPYNGGMSFASKSDCVLYFGRLTQKHYFEKGYVDTYSINKKYEPGNDNWCNMVNSIMASNFKKLNL